MLDSIQYKGETYKVGDKVSIIEMGDKLSSGRYNGTKGVIESVDDMGCLHGTWGSLALIPEIDTLTKIG